MPAEGEVRRNALATIVGLIAEEFADFSFTELTALLAVAEHEGVSVSSVARLCRFTEATASRTIRRLAPEDMPGALAPARGLLILARAPNDNRSRYVFLTPRGRALCRAFDAVIADRSRTPLAGSDPLGLSVEAAGHYRSAGPTRPAAISS
jgi:DNA-binding MarR family transcriptional regulator